MGNLAEAGGFGDTRIPSEGDEDDQGNFQGYIYSENVDPSQYTYRNGVNYKKNNPRKSSQFEDGTDNAL